MSSQLLARRHAVSSATGPPYQAPPTPSQLRLLPMHQGLGDALLDYVEQELRQRGFRRIALVVEAGSCEFFIQVRLPTAQWLFYMINCCLHLDTHSFMLH